MATPHKAAEILQRPRWTEPTEADLRDGQIYDLLCKEFGVGDRPDLRLPWFEKVEKSCQRGGPERQKALTTALSRSKGKKNPARWFISTITRSFEQHGWM